MVTNKQLEANRSNCKLGGVKTTEGKNIVRFNARKHGILSKLINADEKSTYKDYIEQLYNELQPNNIIEDILVERIAVHYIKLTRLMKAESEYMAYVTNLDEFDFDITFTSKNDKPAISTDNFEKLISLYQRYEVSTENRLYKAIDELRKIKMGLFGNYEH
jgi:exoribonuclease R